MSDKRLQARLGGHCARCLGEIKVGQWIVEAERPRPYHGYKLQWSHAVCPCDLYRKPMNLELESAKSTILRIVDGKVVEG